MYLSLLTILKFIFESGYDIIVAVKVRYNTEDIIMIKERVEKLRALMAQKNIDAYIIPTDDFHGSEYVGDYFKCRAYISGFTGSAGTAVVTADKAGLWTDGRYFIQAAQELSGSGIDLYKMGNPDVPTIEEFLLDELNDGAVLGFDGRTMVYSGAERLKKELAAKNVRLAYEEDLIGMIWDGRPQISKKPAWLLPLEFAGVSREDKIAQIREQMKKENVDVFLLTSLDDIAWLLNFRGGDVYCNTVVLSYAVITEKQILLFTDAEKFEAAALDELAKAGVTLKEYDDVYEYVKGIKGTVWADPSKANYKLIKNLSPDTDIRYGRNFTLLPKAVKNETEIDNMRRTHIKDGAAITKLMYFLKHRESGSVLTEMDVDAKIEEFRGEKAGYIEPSFETAYGPSAAIVHYTADEASNRTLEDKGLILIDTGGTYMGGTTDITRTIALGPLTDTEKKHYTAVLKGNLDLGATEFPQGTRGINLDAIARRPIWAIGCDYNHGTGHGIGYMLNVHEGPNSIRNKVADSIEESAELQPGMITSNEPGIYIENSHGIRLETLVLCCEKIVSDGEAEIPMLYFETLTLVPYDLDAVVPEMLSEEQKNVLNSYHARVYDEISPLLTKEETEWLKYATRSI